MLYSTSFRTTVTTANNACFEITTPSNQGCRIMEIGITNAAATAATISLGHPSTASATSTLLANGLTGAGFWPEQEAGLTGVISGQTGLAYAMTNVAKTSISLAATTPAVCSTTVSPVFRRASVAGTVGAGVVWTFPKGLQMSPGCTGLSAICGFVQTGATTFDGYAIVDE